MRTDQSGTMVDSISDTDQVGSKLQMKDTAIQTTEFIEINLMLNQSSNLALDRNDSSVNRASQKRRKADPN